MIKKIGVLVAVFLFAAPAVSYFKYRRHSEPTTSTGQHYIVVDESFWLHARPDLSDIRMYANEKEIPYQLTIESGGVETEQKQFRVLQPASASGKTQFVLDMSGVPEYDRINLKLTTKNFVAHARVEGQDDLHGKHWALLGTTTLYDLTDEKLGDNSTLQIPLSAFKYLRVTVDSTVKPADVESGTAGVTRAETAVMREVGSVAKQEQQGKDTVLTFSIPTNTPVDRLTLQIDPTQGNFRREIDIRGPEQQSYGSGEISRIHIQRNGQKVDVEQTSIDLCGNCQGYFQSDNSQRRRHAAAHHRRASATDGAPHLLRFRRCTATVALLWRRKTRTARNTTTPNYSRKKKPRSQSRSAQKSSTPPTPADPTAARGPSVIRLYYGSPLSPPC